ncbi:hypothetical protein H2198_007871 [Neophaeococcomyces mojaviensis]|uniref:Uncharacterized protein n=1 Tax=Neophaeococcomyces mojaviensis TaxID=3383035 RepID=A0ACC2ZZH6_9EURO|nr:hypothetical protein H2198_007871 [Knufia sp. JES_112]
MSAPARSPSPSPPPAAPSTTAAPTSRRFVNLRKVYAEAIRATLAKNSYENFSSCFPTPATYCPSALEGVWKQLNSRLEEECIKDFEKICEERDVENGLRTWEGLVEDARRRKTEAEALGEGGPGMGEQVKPGHLMSAQELGEAFMAQGLLRTEKELQGKLEDVQQRNGEMMGQIEEQRAEIGRLIEAIEGLVTDVEGAAGVLETDAMREDLRVGVQGLDADVEMRD